MLSKTTYYRKLKRSKELGCSIDEVPDNRGRHKNHARGPSNGRWRLGKGNGKSGELAPRWNGGRRKHYGYWLIYNPNHSRADVAGYVREHILIAEKALQKALPDGACPHHVDGNGLNNQNRNLIICQDNAYHQLIEQRTRAFNACGHANWRKCKYCKRYDDLSNLYIPKSGGGYHQSCYNTNARNKYSKRQALRL